MGTGPADSQRTAGGSWTSRPREWSYAGTDPNLRRLESRISDNGFLSELTDDSFRAIIEESRHPRPSKKTACTSQPFTTKTSVKKRWKTITTCPGNERRTAHRETHGRRQHRRGRASGWIFPSHLVVPHTHELAKCLRTLRGKQYVKCGHMVPPQAGVIEGFAGGSRHRNPRGDLRVCAMLGWTPSSRKGYCTHYE